MKRRFSQLSVGALFFFMSAHISVALGQSSGPVVLDPLQPIVVNNKAQPCLECTVVRFELKRSGYAGHLVKGNQVPLSYLLENKSNSSNNHNDTVFVRNVVYVKRNQSSSKNLKRRFIEGDYGYFLLDFSPKN